MDKIIPKNPLQFGIFLSKLQKKWVISALFFVMIATAFDRFTVLVLENLTNAIAAHPIDFHSVWTWAIAYPVLFFMGQNSWRGSGFTAMRWLMGIRSYGYQTLYEYLTLHSKDYFNNRFAGTLTNKISNAVEGTNNLCEKILWRFFPLIAGVILYIIFTWANDFRLGLIITVWSVLFLLVNIWFARKLQPHSFRFAQSQSTLKGRIVDSLTNISLVHEYAYISGEQDYIEEFVKKQKETGLTMWSRSETVLLINGFLIFLFMIAMSTTTVYLFEKRLVSVGVIIMVVAIIADLARQLFFIGQEMRDAVRYYGEAKEGLAEILHEHLITDAPQAQDVTLSQGAISIENIDFNYENTRVFKNFSLSIPAGQKVGLIGRSGAGKTTFVSLLLRHFDVQDGAIKIDGKNILDVTLESLRRAIAFVPQDTSLFHRTIWENIRYSNPRATKIQVRRAAKQAQADEFIKKLPHGYDTLVGERGVKLSGGQRQRIAIARAFLKNAPILILDEATSSLDSQSEQAIQESLEQLMKGRTVIAIAHRLSTLKEMDRLVIIENGKIVEDGAPETLLKIPNGVFKKMWDHQVKGFIVDDE